MESTKIPVTLFVVLNKAVAESLHGNEPTWHSLVDERGIRAPAERIAVNNGRALQQAAISLHLLNDSFIGILYAK